MNRKQRRAAAKARGRSAFKDSRSAPTDTKLKAALSHHQAGRLAEAKQLFSDILSREPKHVGALHLLGVIAYQEGDARQATALIGKAIALRPDYAEAHSNLGNALRDQGKLEDAVVAYCRALELNPDYADAHNNLGNALKDQGKLEDAVVAYRRALELKPDYAEAHYNLGDALKDQGKLEDAVVAYRRALELKPDYADAHNNLGNALKDQGKLEDAVVAYRRALELKPGYAKAHNNLGNALYDQGMLEDAVVAYCRALELKPDYAEAHSNLGNALKDQGKLEDAVVAYCRALELKPDYAEAHENLGMSLMLLGKLDEGFREYEWRWKKRDFCLGEYLQPQWDGQEYADKTVLIHAEQGLGDTIQFIRYAPLCRARGGRVVFECPKPLVELLRGVDGVDQMVSRGEPVSPFDFHTPLLNLPRIFGTTLADIPADVPYISVPDGVATPPLDPVEGRLRVGIVWQGNPRHKNDRNRSCPLNHFEALARRDDLTFYSLQVGPVAADLEDLAVDASIHDMGTQLNNFADTAAVVAQLDLVITVDTAMAHLVGALARPVWTLLPFAPDWRWLLGRDDSPWYPTMRLFRQARPGDWHDVFDRVDRALTVLTAESDRR